MSVDWALYDLLLGNGKEITSARQDIINNSVQNFIDGIKDDPAYQTDTTVNGVVTPLIVSPSSSSKCEIKAPPGTSLIIGDTVEYLGENWLVTELYTDKIGVINGVMRMCNASFKFQNMSNVIHSRYCIIDDGSISKRGSGDHVYARSGAYDVYVSIDTESKKLHLDKRISFGTFYSDDGEQKLEVFKIIDIDLRTKNFGVGSHLMVLTVQRDVYNPETDDISTGVCDVYQDENPSIEPGTSGGRCVILGRDALRIGTKYVYSASFINALGTEVEIDNPVWDVTAPAGVIYESSANKCTFIIPLSEEIIGESIIIKVSDADGHYGICEKEVGVIPIG